MKKRLDAHDNPVTPEREEFQSALIQRAVGDGLPGYKVAAYKPGRIQTLGLLRQRPSRPAPVAEWTRHRLNSKTIERGLRRALDPAEPDLFMEFRLRVVQASWLNNVNYLSIEDCQQLLMLSLHESREFALA